MHREFASLTQTEGLVNIKKYKTASEKANSDIKYSNKQGDSSNGGGGVFTPNRFESNYFEPVDSTFLSPASLQQAKWFIPNSHQLFSGKNLSTQSRGLNTKNLISSKINRSKQLHQNLEEGPSSLRRLSPSHSTGSPHMTPQYPCLSSASYKLCFDPLKSPATQPCSVFSLPSENCEAGISYSKNPLILCTELNGAATTVTGGTGTTAAGAGGTGRGSSKASKVRDSVVSSLKSVLKTSRTAAAGNMYSKHYMTSSSILSPKQTYPSGGNLNPLVTTPGSKLVGARKINTVPCKESAGTALLRRSSKQVQQLTPRSVKVTAAAAVPRTTRNLQTSNVAQVTPFKSAFSERKRKTENELAPVTLRSSRTTNQFSEAKRLSNHRLSNEKFSSCDSKNLSAFGTDSVSTQPTLVDSLHHSNQPCFVVGANKHQSRHLPSRFTGIPLERRSSTSTIDCIPAPITPFKFPLSSSPSEEDENDDENNQGGGSVIPQVLTGSHHIYNEPVDSYLPRDSFSSERHTSDIYYREEENHIHDDPTGDYDTMAAAAGFNNKSSEDFSANCASSILQSLLIYFTPHIKAIVASELSNHSYNFNPHHSLASFSNFKFKNLKPHNNTVNLEIPPRPELNTIVEESKEYLQHTLSKLAQYCDSYRNVLTPQQQQQQQQKSLKLTKQTFQQINYSPQINPPNNLQTPTDHHRPLIDHTSSDSLANIAGTAELSPEL